MTLLDDSRRTGGCSLRAASGARLKATLDGSQTERALTYIRGEYTLARCGFTWDEVKRKRNLKDHGFDFVDAKRVFAGATFTYEDDRFRYDEQRFVTLGLLQGVPVSIVHTSFRKATKRETAIPFENL